MKSPFLLRAGWLALGLLCLEAHATKVMANDVVWQTPTNVSSPTDVVTSGTLIGAYDVSGSPVTVFLNGVRFSPFAVSSGTVDSFTLTLNGDSYNTGYGSINPPYSALDPNYAALLGSALGVYNSGKSFTLTMGSLTVGEEYTVQFWVSESSATVNPIVPSSEYPTVITDGSNSTTLDTNTTNEGGGVGQYVVGTFTADSTSKTFTFTAGNGGSPVLNGFQLRKAIADPAAVTWQTPSTISGPGDVTTAGDLVAAYNVQGSAQAATVNGVLFGSLVVDETGGTAGSSTITSSFSPTYQGSNHGSGNAPFVNLNTDYQTLLQSGYTVYPGASYNRWFTLTMGSLSVGEEYTVQFWVNESQSYVNSIDTGAEKPTIISSGTSVTVDRNTSNANGGVGQFVVGTFTATSATQTFTFSAADGAAPTLNAFQLRKVSHAPQFVSTELPAIGESFVVTGGTGPYTFIVTGGAMPSGLSLSSTGEISGTITGTVSGSVIIQVTDSNSQSSTRVFDYHYDLGRPEISLRRVVITAGGGTQRLTTFEVVAGDDVALSPLETDLDYTLASHCFEYRYKTGTGAFGNWTPAVYYPGTAQPSVWFDNTQSLRFEMRSVDASGVRSRVIAYDIAKNIAASTQTTFGTTLATPVTLLSGAGSSIVKLFAEDLNNTSLTTEVAALDRDTGKLSIIYNTNRTTPASSAKTSLSIPGTPVVDAAVGRLLPLGATGANDAMQDFVVCTANGLRVVTNKTGVAPVLSLHPTTALAAPGITFKRVAVGDVDADGDDDIVAVGENAGSWSLAVFLNQAGTSTSGFGAPSLITLDIDAVRCVTAGDINSDGAADVVIGVHSTHAAAGVDSVLCFMSTPKDGLIAPVVETTIGHEVVDVKIADYTGHRLGQKDVIVGTIEGADTAYPFATHMAKHRVLVHRVVGLFDMAPARTLAAITLTSTEEANDKAVFNIATAPFSMLNGSLTNRVTPDIVGCQYASTGPGATLDDGFLPPADANRDLHWMNGDANGVVNIGTSTGKARRVALGDLMGSTQLDVILADADSGNLVVMRNDKALLNPMPSGVTPSKTLPVPVQTLLAPGGRLNGATSGISFQPWQFKYTIAGAPADTVAKVEYQLNGGVWTTLPGGTLAKSGTVFSVTVPSVPLGLLRFRCWATSAAQSALGVYDSYSAHSPLIRSIDSQSFVVTARAMPDSDPSGNVSTHDNEYVRYELNYENTGSAPASNVVLAGAIPANTTFGGVPSNPGSGATTGAIFDNLDSLKTKVVSWDLGTLAPGETGMRYFLVQVKSNALAVLKGKPIELKAMSAAALKSPPATAALFRSTTAANGTFGIYSTAPAAGFTPQVATGSTASTPVVPPLTMTQVVSSSSVAPGAVIDVEIILRNYAANQVHNIVVKDSIESHFAVEAVRLRTPANAPTGNFDGLLDPDPLAAQNPSLAFTPVGGTLTWNVGTLDGVRNALNQAQPPGECRIRYQLRVRYDVSPFLLKNDNLIARNLDFGGLSAEGTLQGTNAKTAARTDIMRRTTAEVENPIGLNPPRISFVQDTVPLVGTNGSTATEPTNRQEMSVGGEDMAVVAEGGLMRVKLRYANTGGAEAKRCLINYYVPTGAEFLGFIRENGTPASLGSNYEFYDSKSVLIPQASLSTRIKEVRGIKTLLGNLAAGTEGVVDFILGAYSPPIPKPANEKVTPAGTVIRSFAYRMESDSYVFGVQGAPSQVPVFVARPVSFNIESRPDQGEIVQTVGVPQTARFFISFRNNGWTAASNVKVQASIPVGTTLVSSQLLNADLSGTGTAGTPRNATNAIVAANLATKVEFTIGTLASGFQDNPAAYGYAEIVVQIPSPLPANFPKDFRLKQRSEITGTDSVTGKRAQGSYSLFAASSGIVTADDVKPLSSASLAELKLIPSNARLFAGKQLPTIVRPGQLFPVIVFFGNTGDTAITNAKVAVQVPWGTDFVSAGTTPGFVKFTDKDTITGQTTPNVYRWTFPTLDGHSAKAVTMMVRVKNNAAYEGNYLFENSAVVTGTVGTTTVARVPGNARMLVLSTNPVASAWQWFGAQLQAVGGNLFGQRPAALQTAVNGITANTSFYTVAGASVMTLPNGALIIPLLGGNVVAAGGGNIVASGGGNIVASGGGNVIAAGAGNLITVTGPGLLSTANLNAAIASIVASGGGNIVASGGGNLIANDGASLIANDGASLGAVSLNLAGVVAAGGGNVVASGGGNIVASGGGNVVASGGGNVTENLSSSRPGSTLIANDGASFIQVNSLLANDGSSLLANDGASLIANDGASLIANDGASILSDQGGGLITK